MGILVISIKPHSKLMERNIQQTNITFNQKNLKTSLMKLRSLIQALHLKHSNWEIQGIIQLGKIGRKSNKQLCIKV
jgi:hypothetical protein